MTMTITLEEELATKVEKLRQELALSFEEVLQRALREGLVRLDTARSYTVPVALGGCLIDDLDDISKALVIAEGEAFG
ncbi:MAG TPA: hypothetical protein VLX28_13100 [Thermoanaerobaculia bacterium]|nr:hypothetical protein [Thermoanaerobaculia bacterium]